MRFYNLQTLFICIFSVIICAIIAHWNVNQSNWISKIFLCIGIISYMLGYLYLTMLSRTPAETVIKLNPFSSIAMLFFKNKFLLGWILNILLYIPFGMFFPIMTKKNVLYNHILIAGLLASFLTETVQRITHLGWFDTEDILMNTIGAVVGFSIYNKFLIRRK